MYSSDRDDVIQQVIAHGRVNGAGWVRVNCPFCSLNGKTEDRRGSFAFNPRTNGFVCNRCKVKGRVGGAIRVGYEQPVSAPDSWKRCRKDFHPLHSKTIQDSSAGQAALEYLSKRGFTLGDVATADMHVAIGGKYHGRVVIPHKHGHGDWWGFTARLMGTPADDRIPKVLYPPGMDRFLLYNEDVLKLETRRPVLVVEGVLDATWYLPDVVACLGKPTAEHMNAFVTAKRPIAFCLDGDAWEEGKALSQRCMIRGKQDAYHVKMLPGEDPNSIDPDWLWEQLEGIEVQRALVKLDLSDEL